MKRYIRLLICFIFLLALGWQAQRTLAAQLSATSTAKLEKRRLIVPEEIISGLVWHDINHNGQVDNQEPGLAGVIVALWGTPPNGLFGLCTSAPTDDSGHYAFNNDNAPWCTTVQITPPAEYPVITHNGDRDFGVYEGDTKLWLPAIYKRD